MKRIAPALLLGLLASCQTLEPIADGPRRIATTSGALVGETSDGRSVFKGVPFAQPPVGALRWPPAQPTSWRGKREAKAFGPPGLQPTPADGSPSGLLAPRRLERRVSGLRPPGRS